MILKKTLLFVFSIFCSATFSQVVLEANGEGDTYELINAVLADPGRDVIEAPDCNHLNFGRHIDEVYDNELNKYVFRFYIHTTPDNDRCIKFDRQRNEIKSYDKSPDNVKATIGETIEYKWKFKLSDDFKPSSNFTHIHQIKSVGGSYESISMITLTLRKSTPDRLELRYTPTNDQNTLKTLNLDVLRGNWVEVKERITYADNGSYFVEIKNILTNNIIFSYSNSSIDMWQDGAEFARPKWGIYRSLINQQDLQDEIVKFADFSIEENPASLSINNNSLNDNLQNIFIVPNPSSKEIEIKNLDLIEYDSIEIYDTSGRNVLANLKILHNKLDVSILSKGLYFIAVKKNALTVRFLKCYIK